MWAHHALTLYRSLSRQWRLAEPPVALMMGRLEATWRRIAPGEPFVASTADVRLSAYYAADQQRARLFMTGSGLAVAIGCFGLYGLAAFNTTRRLKEIGIRKTLGASTAEVLRHE